MCTAAANTECRYFINWPDFWKICLKLACNYNFCNKILVSMVMREECFSNSFRKKKPKGDDSISEKMKFSTLFHSWTASCRFVNRLVAFFPFYIGKIRVINRPQAFFAKRRFNELYSIIRTEEHTSSLPLSMQRNTTNRRMALPYSLQIY